MSNLLKNKKFSLAIALSNSSRYIDDVCFLNYKHFVSIVDSIYPADLIAERSGEEDKKVEYLDVQMKETNSNLQISFFHKVDHFKFQLILLTFPE